MENLNQRNKELEKEIMEDIERDSLIQKFNKNINGVFSNFTEQFTKQKIYFNLVLKYINSKQQNDVIKHYPKLSHKYRKEINTVYIYSLFYIYLKFNLFYKDNKKNKNTNDQNKYKSKILPLINFFKLIRFFYKNNLINWRKVINIFKYIIYQIKSRNNELQTSLKISTLSIYLKFFVKMVKDLEKEEKEKDQINEEIKKDILDELFEILADAKNNGNYLYFMRHMIKEESIFFLVKILVKSDFLSDENKQYIEVNIIKMLKNNFKREHLNYFYKIFNKILIKFNKFNPNLIEEEKSMIFEKENYEKHFTRINKIFSLLEKINEILIKAIKEEKEQITNNQCYYCDKGFVFNNRDKERIGFKVKDILYTKKSNNNFCILFSFQLRESGFDKENKIIFSIVDSDNNEKLTLYENGNHIYIRYFTKKLNEAKLHKVEYNTIFNFLLFNDKNNIKISINNNDVLYEKAADFKLPDNFQVFVGCPEEMKNNKNKEYSFNGIMYPILLFEINEPKKKEKDIYVDFKKLLCSVKNKYYLIAEEFFNYSYNINNKEKEKENEDIEKIMHNYEIYYGLGEDLSNKKKVAKFFFIINNMILYINPYIIVSTFNKKSTIFKDYNKYKNENKKEINYLYEFNVIPSLEQGKIYAFRDYNIVSFFKTNNGLNFIILQMETLFNYILLLSNKKEYLQLPNKDRKNFFAKM